MKIVICYIAVTHGPLTQDYCSRFVATYHEYPPGVEHDTLVICNGGPLDESTAIIFSTIGAKMFPRSNEHWDLGGYIEAARGPCKEYDMMVCLGESVYFHREGWLTRLQEAWLRYGPGMYGPFASNMVRPHLNTTAFCTAPVLLSKSPVPLKDRYAWEHGPNAFWRHVAKHGMPVRLVTWDGEWEPRMWRGPPNILWRGDQSNCLMWCNHTDRWIQVNPRIQSAWSRSADSKFK